MFDFPPPLLARVRRKQSLSETIAPSSACASTLSISRFVSSDHHTPYSLWMSTGKKTTSHWPAGALANPMDVTLRKWQPFKLHNREKQMIYKN